VPIDTVEFPSNWDLSSARATTVVREFVQNGISPKRLSAIGYGEFHPVADNNNEVGRNKNRRVVLVLMSQAFARYGMSDKKRAEVLNLNSSGDTPSEPQ
jgi:chemotaxis protein MotB